MMSGRVRTNVVKRAGIRGTDGGTNKYKSSPGLAVDWIQRQEGER